MIILKKNELNNMMIISIKKQKEFPISKLELTKNIVSIEKNELVKNNSSLKEDYIQILEFNPKISLYCEQPIKIIFQANNKLNYYEPDFYIEYIRGKKELIEINPEKKFKIGYLEYLKKNKVIKEFCDSNNIDYNILTEKEIRNDLLFNSTFLLNFKSAKYGFRQEDTMIIHELLDKYEKLTITQLLDFSTNEQNRKAELLYVIWYMVANYFIKIDLTQKISMNSTIYKYK